MSALMALMLVLTSSDAREPVRPGYYDCETRDEWGEYYSATLSRAVEPGKIGALGARFELLFRDRMWAETMTARWDVAHSGPLQIPDRLYFVIPTSKRLRDGEILLRAEGKGALSIEVRKPAVRHLRHSGMLVELGDAAQRAAVAEGPGWQFRAVDGSGRLVASGPFRLPPRGEMETRFRSLWQRLEAKAAAPESQCRFVEYSEEATL